MVPIRSHFMHQGHALAQNLNSTKEYLCGGCKTNGNGTNFGCEPCSFHMHDFCSNCPLILSSFLHPQHPLSLMISNTQFTASPRICDVCGDTAEGLFYWCQHCDFNVHPLCTQFPQSLRHAVHLPHSLMFQKSYKDAPCWVCGGVCNAWSWRYRCGDCDGFDVHLDCVAKSYVTTSRRLSPYAGIYTYGTGVNSTTSSYNIYKPPYANDQTIRPCNMYNPHGGVPSNVNTYSTYNSHGLVPHGHGTYAYQPNNSYGDMPVGTNSHNMCHSCSESASSTYQNGMPLDTNSYNMYNSYHGLPYYTNPNNMHSLYNGVPFDSNLHNGDNHHADASHQAPPHNAQTAPSQGQGLGKLGSKIFGIVSTLTLGVISNVIFGQIF